MVGLLGGSGSTDEEDDPVGNCDGIVGTGDVPEGIEVSKRSRS